MAYAVPELDDQNFTIAKQMPVIQQAAIICSLYFMATASTRVLPSGSAMLHQMINDQQFLQPQQTQKLLIWPHCLPQSQPWQMRCDSFKIGYYKEKLELQLSYH